MGGLVEMEYRALSLCLFLRALLPHVPGHWYELKQAPPPDLRGPALARVVRWLRVRRARLQAAALMRAAKRRYAFALNAYALAASPQLPPGFEPAQTPSSPGRPPPVPGAGPVTNGGTGPPPLPTVDPLAQDLHFLKLYRGREAVHAEAIVTGANGEQRVEYRPVHRALTDDDLRRHLDGSKVLGVYPIREDSTCLFGAIDVDAEDQQDLGLAQTKELHAAAMRLGFPEAAMVISFSGRKGYHLDFFFAQPIPAGSVRLFLEAVVAEAGIDADL